jgi:hypothetical protein
MHAFLTTAAPGISVFARAPGKPLCVHGLRCYRANPTHWKEFDHPAKHTRLFTLFMQ